MLAVRYQTPTMRDLRFKIFLGGMQGDGVEDVTELLAQDLQSDFCLFSPALHAALLLHRWRSRGSFAPRASPLHMLVASCGVADHKEASITLYLEL